MSRSNAVVSAIPAAAPNAASPSRRVDVATVATSAAPMPITPTSAVAATAPFAAHAGQSSMTANQ
jgi:hypothetical protein